jgi:anti-anti-sigma factor
MKMDQFSVEIVDRRLVLRGELDLGAVPQFEASAAGLNGQVVDVDLSGVTFLDSSGLRALWNAGEAHPGLRFVNPSAVVSRLLELTQMDDLISE